MQDRASTERLLSEISLNSFRRTMEKDITRRFLLDASKALMKFVEEKLEERHRNNLAGIFNFYTVDILKIIKFVNEKEKLLMEKLSILFTLLNDPLLGKNLLTSPPEVKLITHPSWEEVKHNTPGFSTALKSFSIFNQSVKDILVEQRHGNAKTQHEYDMNYGLIIIPTMK
jgi:hypothetical protein